MDVHFTTFEITALTVLLVLLIGLSAFFAGSEMAILSMDWLRLRYLARKGNRKAKYLEETLARKDRFIGTILVCNNIVNIAGSSIATALALSFFGESGIAIATGLMTVFLLIFGEITPKNFASRHVEWVALNVAPLYKVIEVVFFPLVFVITGISNGILRLFGVKTDAHVRPGLSEEELKALISDTKNAANVAEDKRKMLHGIFLISRKTAREVMTPRLKIVALDVTISIPDALAVFAKTGFARLPVYREEPDQIIGVLHARDMLKLDRDAQGEGLAAVMRDTLFVPENMTLENLLLLFRRESVHMAMVVDEYGGLEGLVTLEDVVEEIVGDIRDEYDLEGLDIRFLPGGEALVNGHTSLFDVNEKLKLNLPTDTDFTLGGFVMTALSKIPKQGDSFEYDNVGFKVERAGKNRVLLVRVTPIGPVQSPVLD